MYEPLVYALLFFGGMAIWIPVYFYVVAPFIGDHVVKRCETGEIDLNYLLDNGGVFDELANRVVTLFKSHMLAEMGQLSRSAVSPGEDGEPLDAVGMGIEASGQILKAVGMKKPPAILQYKLAQVLGAMLDKQAGNEAFDFQPPPDFGP
jgi:hypothetical protein